MAVIPTAACRVRREEASARDQHLAGARQSSLFEGVPAAAVERLLATATVHRLPRGATLVGQGQTDLPVIHILVSGSVGLRAVTEDGDATLLGILRPGAVFLLTPLLLGAASDVSAETLTSTRVVAIPTVEFRRVLLTEPALSAAALRLMAAHCRDLAEQLVDVKLRGAEERLTRFLRQRAATGPRDAAAPVEMPEPKSAVALRLGMTPESLSRSLGALARRDVIRHQKDGGLALLRAAPPLARPRLVA